MAPHEAREWMIVNYENEAEMSHVQGMGMDRLGLFGPTQKIKANGYHGWSQAASLKLFGHPTPLSMLDVVTNSSPRRARPRAV